MGDECPQGAIRHHIIQNGESVRGIAQRYGVDPLVVLGAVLNISPHMLEIPVVSTTQSDDGGPPLVRNVPRGFTWFEDQGGVFDRDNPFSSPPIGQAIEFPCPDAAAQDEDTIEKQRQLDSEVALLEQVIANSEALLQTIEFDALVLLTDVLVGYGQEVPEIPDGGENLEAWLRSEEGAGYRPSGIGTTPLVRTAGALADATVISTLEGGPIDDLIKRIFDPVQGLADSLVPDGIPTPPPLPIVVGEDFPQMTLSELVQVWEREITEDTLPDLLSDHLNMLSNLADSMDSPPAEALTPMPPRFPIEETPYWNDDDVEGFWTAVEAGDYEAALTQLDLSPVRATQLGLDLAGYDSQIITTYGGAFDAAGFDVLSVLDSLSETAHKLSGFIDAVETDRIHYILDHWDEEGERAKLEVLQANINRMPFGDLFGLPSGNVRAEFQSYCDAMMARHQALAELNRFRETNRPETQDRELVMRYLLQARVRYEANRLGRDPRHPAWERMTWVGLNAELEALLRLPENFDLMVPYHRELFGLSPDYGGPDLLGLMVGVSLFLLSLDPVAGRVIAVIGLLRGDVTELIEFVPFGRLGASLHALGDGARAVPRRIRNWVVRNADDVMRQWDDAMRQWDEAQRLVTPEGRVLRADFDDLGRVRISRMDDAGRGGRTTHTVPSGGHGAQLQFEFRDRHEVIIRATDDTRPDSMVGYVTYDPETQSLDYVLEFENPDTHIRHTTTQGRDAFREAFRMYEADFPVNHIRGTWVGGTNYGAFWRAKNRGGSDVEAVRETWTAGQAFELGFTEITSVRYDSWGGTVWVVFSRPGN